MCETKTTLVLQSLILLVAAIFCMCQAHTKNRDTTAESKLKIFLKLSIGFLAWMVNATIYSTKRFYAVIVYGGMEKIVVKSKCGGAG